MEFRSPGNTIGGLFTITEGIKRRNRKHKQVVMAEFLQRDLS
jgi:hypothetical protein